MKFASCLILIMMLMTLSDLRPAFAARASCLMGYGGDRGLERIAIALGTTYANAVRQYPGIRTRSLDFLRFAQDVEKNQRGLPDPERLIELYDLELGEISYFRGVVATKAEIREIMTTGYAVAGDSVVTSPTLITEMMAADKFARTKRNDWVTDGKAIDTSKYLSVTDDAPRAALMARELFQKSANLSTVPASPNDKPREYTVEFKVRRIDTIRGNRFRSWITRDIEPTRITFTLSTPTSSDLAAAGPHLADNFHVPDRGR